MQERLKSLSDLSNVKVGDKVWTSRDGWCIVEKIDCKDIETYPLLISGNWYTVDGRYEKNDFLPTAFLSNPYESLKEEKWMMVGSSKDNLIKRRVFMVKNGKFLAWNNAETDKAANKSLGFTLWDYAEEIPDTIELSIEDIASKLGIDASKLRIKK